MKKEKPKKTKRIRHKLEPFTSEGLEKRSYQSAPIPQIICFFKSWLSGFMWVLIALFLIDKICSYFIPMELFSKSGIWNCILLAGFAIALFRVVYWCNIRIEICRKGVIFYRLNRPYKCYPIEAVYRLQIKTNYYKGIPIGSNKLMYIGLGDNDTRMEECHCISKSDFSAIQSDIEKIKRDGHFGRTETLDMTVDDIFFGKEIADFVIPKDALLGSEKKRLIQIICVCFGIGIVMLILWSVSTMKQEMDMDTFVMCVIICLLPGILASVIQGIRYVIYARKLPQQISLSTSGISLDGSKYFWVDMKQIGMTGVDNTMVQNRLSGRRWLKLYHKDQKIMYPIGNSFGVSAKSTYLEYESLLQAVKECCDQRQIPFREM